MSDRVREPIAVGLGVALLAFLAWSMVNLSYDIWGAFIVGPVLLVIGVPMLRRMFRGSQRSLFGVMLLGMVTKLLGGIARYWVSFDAYGGSTDAQRYHLNASAVARGIWSGRLPWTEAIPYGTGTAFMDRFVGLVYTVVGTSRLAGFFVFAWLSFWGIALFVKAAVTAVPNLARRNYALFVALAPSIVFWPSSIGKEAYMLLTLGIGTLGIARLFALRRFRSSMMIIVVGLGAAAFVRPHMAAIWGAGLFFGLAVAIARGRGAGQSRGRSDLAALIGLGLAAVVGLFFIARTTVDYLSPRGEDLDLSVSSLGDILSETARRTSESGSTYVPPDVSSPFRWPYAIVRTLLRPLPHEVAGMGQQLATLEIMVFLVLCLVFWRRVVNLPRAMMTNPYVTFAVTTLLLTGLAYSSFANLGVLTRQKSLIFPFLLLIPCLPEGSSAPALRRDRGAGQNSSTSPSVSDQLESGGNPASFTARQVRTGPPPGRAIDADDIWG